MGVAFTRSKLRIPTETKVTVSQRLQPAGFLRDAFLSSDVVKT